MVLGNSMKAEEQHPGMLRSLGRKALGLSSLTAGLVLGAVIALVVQSYGPDVLHEIFGSVPRLGAQLDSIAHEAASEGDSIVWHEYVNSLHGGEHQRSLLLKLSDLRDLTDMPTANPRPRPDEFRIYDLKSFPPGEPQLTLRFRFRPSPTYELGTLVRWRFNVRKVVQLSGSGQNYVVADFTEDRADESTRRPVLIYWDPNTRRYIIRALVPRPIEPLSVPHPGIRTAGYLREYGETEHLVDQRSGTTVTPYATTAYAVCGSGSGITTVTALWVSEGGPGPNTLQLTDSAISQFPSAHLFSNESPRLWRITSDHFPTEHELIKKARRAYLYC